ncbi:MULTISPECIES: hypothetical protein [Rhodococcus]|uniref:hypothetical protein n=1 Tax=Rhodococcus TaxID=1827 RepID=UPI001ED96046|nr:MULTISPECIES: hypothetical protein [Rhodococcus]
MSDVDDEAGIGAPLRAVDIIEVGVDPLCRTEQPQHFFDDVCADVAQQPAGRAGFERAGTSRSKSMSSPRLENTGTPGGGLGDT